MKLCIIGGKGNMGRRYAAIANMENMYFHSIDVNDPIPTDFTHYLIATPTETHEAVLTNLCNMREEPVKVLIEKPYTIIKNNDMNAFQVLGKLSTLGHKIYMVNQYAYYSHDLCDNEGPTYYDYYHSGKDGIMWDCIQIIHLARNGVKFLNNQSPIWHCMINGVKLNRELIDLCYVKMLKDFCSDGKLYGRLWGIRETRQAHQAVMKYEAGLNRYTS